MQQSATEIIKYAIKRSGCTITYLSKATGIPQRTIYRRIKHPRQFLMGELDALDREICMTDEEWKDFRRAIRI